MDFKSVRAMQFQPLTVCLGLIPIAILGKLVEIRAICGRINLFLN